MLSEQEKKDRTSKSVRYDLTFPITAQWAAERSELGEQNYGKESFSAANIKTLYTYANDVNWQIKRINNGIVHLRKIQRALVERDFTEAYFSEDNNQAAVAWMADMLCGIREYHNEEKGKKK